MHTNFEYNLFILFVILLIIFRSTKVKRISAQYSVSILVI